MRIISYAPKYKNDFVEMNKAWISEMFELEEEDIKEMGNIEPAIEKGGQIFFAIDDFDAFLAIDDPIRVIRELKVQ